MSESDTAVADQSAEATAETAADAEEAVFEYPVKVEETAPGTKKISVEIPRARIDEKIKKQFGELRKQVALPGFRVGRAPQRLIEKRFASDVRDEVRRTLISESYQQVIEKNKLEVLGEPEFDEIDKVTIPDGDGPMNYTFSVEVQPDFEIPDLFSLTVKKPRIEIKDENLEQAMTNLREQQGALLPVEDRGVEEKDYLTADVTVKLGDEELAKQQDAQLVARPGRIGGVQVDDLADKLKGLKPGEERSFTITASDSHSEEKVRGQELTVNISLKDVKRLELAQITDSFLADLGFTTEAELRDALKEQMQEKIDSDVRQAMREQIARYLLDAIKFDLPQKLSERQSDRIAHRRAMDLLMRGVGKEQIEQNLELLKTGAAEEAQRELKLYFILQKLAGNLNVDIGEDELNGQIAYMAIQRNQRPETLKKEMAQNGQLLQMYIQMREQKALDTVLNNVKMEEVELKENEELKAEQKGDTNGGEAAKVDPEA